MAITHVIFDAGGTIFDIASIIATIFRNYAISIEKELSPEVEVSISETESLDSIYDQFLNSLNLIDEELRIELKANIVQQLLAADIPLIRGVEKLIIHLHKHNIQMAIATNGTDRELPLIHKNFGKIFNKCFSHCVFGGTDPEVKNNKPSPDVYLVCAKRFKTEPNSVENCVIFEDSMTGITGAVASGMKTVLINDRRICSFETIANKITLIVDSFDDFRPESVGLPKYD